MRMYKKAAVCLLAAAMAISMMTACGGSGGSNGGSNSGNNGTSQGGEENPGDKDDNNSGDKDDQGDKKDDQDTKKDDSVIPADPAKVTWDTSLTKKAYDAISADNFKISGVFASGGAFGYATQGTKQLMIEQEDENQLMAFYTSDGKDLYIAACEIKNNTKMDMKALDWKSAEEYGEGMTAEEIAAEKQDTLDEMKEMKDTIYIADKVVPLTFSAENYTDTQNQEFYREVVKANVDSVLYTYDFYYTVKDITGQLVYKKGDMTSIRRVNGGTTMQLFVTSQPSRCDSNTFPTVK